MDYVAEIHQFSQEFFADYPALKYPELMHKQGRPYNCLLIDSNMDYCICIPFRSDISHNNAYLFKNSLRSKQSKSGLDYSKSVIVTDGRYFDAVSAVVDKDEYSETVMNMQRIVREISAYVNGYVEHITGIKTLHPKEFQRKYCFSTLPYFHKELGIQK